MADENDNKPAAAPKAEKAPETTVQVETSDGFEAPEFAPVRVQPGALVGDAAVADGNVNDVSPEVYKDEVAAQTTGPAAPEVSTVQVHETYVSTDQVITDPHSPQAVQMPDAGRGTLDLPIHALAGETVEAFFAREAS